MIEINSSGGRKKIGVAIASNFMYRDLNEGKLLDTFAKRFNLVFIVAPKVDTELLDTVPTIRMQYSHRWRRICYNTAKGLIHYHNRRHFVATKEYALYRSFAGVSPKQRAILRILIKLGIGRILGHLLRFILRQSAPLIIPNSMRLDGIFNPTSIESDFQDDVVREARRLNLPLLAYQGSWDNVTMKTFMETPDYLAVWGEQSFLIARFIHNLMPHQIFVTGTPRCDSYASKIDVSSARKMLNLPQGKKIVLLCGTSAPFDEHTPLNNIIDAFRNKTVPDDVCVLFRPHPQRIPRTSEPPFKNYPPYVYYAPDQIKGLSNIDFYPIIMSAVDAVISPFSTMAIEAASFGIPVLNLRYNHKNHANFDWERQGFELHNYAFLHSDWSISCTHPDDVVKKLLELLSLVGSSLHKKLAISSAEMVFRTGIKSASERLCDAMATVILGNDSDESYINAKNSTKISEIAAIQHHRDKDG